MFSNRKAKRSVQSENHGTIEKQVIQSKELTRLDIGGCAVCSTFLEENLGDSGDSNVQAHNLVVGLAYDGY